MYEGLVQYLVARYLLYHSIFLHNSSTVWFKANKRSFPATFIFH